MYTICPDPLPRKEFIGNMKRAAIFLLVFSLLAGLTLTAEAASSYTLPDALKTVPGTMLGLFEPGELPPHVEINRFSVDENGTIRLELSQAVPRLKILERDAMTDIESTIFSKKNTDTADTHMVGREDSVFIVRMIWKVRNMDYIREYTTWSGNAMFSACTATEEVDPAGFEPFTSVIRTINFNEMGVPYSETWTLENGDNRFFRNVSYDWQGNLTSLKQVWESATGEYQYATETDKDGNLTALTVKDKKTQFYAESMQLNESTDSAALLSVSTLDSASFDEQLAAKYPQLSRGLIDYAAGETEFDPGLARLFNMPAVMEGKTPNPSNIMYPGPSTITDLGPSTITDLGPSTMADLGPSTMTDLGPSTMTDLPAVPDEELEPIPANARIWALNFGDFITNDVYAFVVTEPLLQLKDGKAFLVPKIKDVNGETVKLKKDRISSPVLEVAVIE